ncbi:MAG: NAD(P)/FAD-dependent oxidoreductase [Spirochaetes bacterium]|nr:NAD(P)/FAD-dependent oxidoreductase [Spirochaetota bacterium]
MEYDVIVVGGGMAGLTAAAFTAHAGHSVLLCDKENRLGGLIGSFERNGFVFDTGARAIEDSGVLFTMLKALGIEMEFVNGSVSVGIEDRVIRAETRENLNDYEKLLAHFYPDSRADIASIMQDIRMVMKYTDIMYGIENPFFKDLIHEPGYILKTMLPWLGKFLMAIIKTNMMREPVEEHLKKFTSSRRLIDIISQHFFRNTPAFFAMGYFSLYLDYHYPVGGTGVLPRRLEEFCLRKKVTIKKNTRIVKIDPDKRMVTDENGNGYSYKQLVWAADMKSMYRSIDVNTIASGTIKKKTRQKIETLHDAKGGDSIFTLYLAVNIAPEYFAGISNGHFFYTPSRDGVGDITKGAYERLVSGARDITSERFRKSAEAWIQSYLQKTTYEISIPAVKDKSLAPAGKSGLIISVLFDYELSSIIREQGWYTEFKKFTGDCMVDTLSASIYPGLRERILDAFSYTPVSIERINGSADGAITGWAFTCSIPAVHRMQYMTTSIRTPLPDICQAGQWSYSPAGVPIALLTGKLAADRVHKKLRWT